MRTYEIIRATHGNRHKYRYREHCERQTQHRRKHRALRFFIGVSVIKQRFYAALYLCLRQRRGVLHNGHAVPIFCGDFRVAFGTAVGAHARFFLPQLGKFFADKYSRNDSRRREYRENNSKRHNEFERRAAFHDRREHTYAELIVVERGNLPHRNARKYDGSQVHHDR